MKKILLLIFLVLGSYTADAQKKYHKLWSEVEKLELEGKFRDASEIVDKILKKAKRSNKSDQIVKGFIYQSKFLLQLEEDVQKRIILEIESTIQEFDFPTNALLESVYAGYLEQYLQSNRYRIRKRTAKEFSKTSNDFEKWDISTFIFQIDRHYKESLKQEDELKKTSIKDFQILLTHSKTSHKFRPTLYDFLAHRAIHFYGADRWYVNRPKERFYINNSVAFSKTDSFKDEPFYTKDSILSNRSVLKMYQKLEVFHKKKNSLAYVDIVLDRLKFVRKHAIIQNKDTLYLKALKSLAKELQGHESSAFVNYHIADFYFQATKKKGAKKDSILKNYRIKALAICDKVLSKYPNSDGGLLLRILKNKIQEQSITVEVEKYIVPDKPFLAKVTFKSIDSLYLSVYKVPQNILRNIFSYKRDSIVLDMIKDKKADVSKFHKLQLQKNFYLYTTEVDLPKFSKGKYIIVASASKTITQIDQLYSYSIITASDFSFVSIDKNNKMMIKVLDRFAGSPIKGAKMIVSAKDFNRNGVTDERGEFYIEKDDKYHPNLNITATYKGDTLSHNRYYLYRYYQNSNDDDTETEAKMSLFLDRSIYRPGQTMYFKGVLIQKKKGKTKVVPNTHVSVIIYDTNNQQLKEFRLKTNEYGSVSGEFKIPKNVLTGEFYIEMDEDYGTDDQDEDTYYDKVDDIEIAEVYFSVEEYKRPKFEVSFDDVKGNFVLGDSIRVSAKAKALLGTSISQAEVSYSITRELIPNWTHLHRPTPKQIIKKAVTKTDSEGNFTASFIATSDSLTTKKEKPIFLYTIKADVTDINGETRSASKVVRVGFHNIKLNVVIANKLDQKESGDFTFQTKNLNDEFINSDVEVSVYKLSSPKRVLRKKPWQPVELPSLNKDDFIRLFRNEVYDSTDIKKYWKKGELVFSKKTKSDGDQKIVLDNMQDWKSGAYVLVVKATDVFKDEVSTEKTFEIYNSEQKKLSDYKLFDYEIMNSNYKEEGYVLLKLKTAAQSLKVNVEGFYQGASVFNRTVSVIEGDQVVKVPINKSYKGKIDFNIYFSKFNSLYSDQFSVNFPEVEKQLNIETLSFRNKLTPDKKETWSFKITDAEQKFTQAEILASMYDSSLDQFKSHSWDNNIGFDQYSYSYNAPRVQSNGLFGTGKFTLLKRQNRFYNVATLVRNYHQLRWFGFNFSKSDYTNKIYLSRIKNKLQSPNYIKGNISGTIADGSGALPGVSILIKGTTTGTETDFDGFYSLNAPTGSELIVSYLGYKGQSILIKESGTYNVLMEEDSNALDEIVVTAYGRVLKSKKSTATLVKVNGKTIEEVPINSIDDVLKGAAAGVSVNTQSGQPGQSGTITIRGRGSLKADAEPLFIVDGEIVDLKSGIQLNLGDFEEISVLKDAAATSLYGSRATSGVVIITTKKGLEELVQLEARTNLKETAFFFPHLTTDRKGEVSFSFDSPQALTKWRFMLLAHNKSLEVGSLEKSAVTQKEINVIPNTPRFLREQDTVIISAKIGNLTKEEKEGTALLQLFDAVTMQPISKEKIAFNRIKTFKISPRGNISIDWELSIPEGLQALQYKIVAKSGKHSDGEANILPVLSNRILITESKPLMVTAGSTQKVTFEKLKKSTSKTQKDHRFTLEYTSNPAWLAIKSLPYLMEFPHECAEQTFSRLYANTLALDIIEKNPRIEQVFKSWKENKTNQSFLQENDDLKSILIEESPWIQDLQSDADTKAQLALLFDKEKAYEKQLLSLSKLKELQMSSGGFPWFAGGKENPFITRHIVAGIGHLERLNVKPSSNADIKKILKKAISYLDKEFLSVYNDYASHRKTMLDVSLNHNTIHYLYTRSFFLDSYPMSEKIKKVAEIYIKKGKESWLDLSLYNKGLFALSLYRNGETEIAKKIIVTLDQQSVQSEENGMYWKENAKSWYWYRSPLETQSLMIEAFSEIENNSKKVDHLKQWLLKNKQTNRWSTTKSTTEAIYALLMQGSDWLSVTDNTVIKIGEEKIKTKKLTPVLKESGTGYIKLDWNSDEITSKMSSVSVQNKSEIVGYGAMSFS